MENTVFEMLNELLDANKHSELREQLVKLNVVDIADYLEVLQPSKTVQVFRILPKDISSDVFSYLETERQEHVISIISDSEISGLMADMFTDDAVDFLEEMPAELVGRILKATPRQNRDEINAFLKYKPKTAGAIMTSEVVDFVSTISIGSAYSQIRKIALDRATVYNIYITNEHRQLLGYVPLRTLIVSSDNLSLEDIMIDTPHGYTNDDQEEISRTMSKYDLLSLPIVDRDDRLCGIVTIDDALDVLEEEHVEDIQKMAGVRPTDKTYLKTNVFKLALNRLPWLMLLLVINMVTATIIKKFETGLEAFFVLVVLMPKIIDTAGNAGSQSGGMVIRGLATGEIKTSDFWQIVYKELRVGLMCGIIVGLISIIPVSIFHDTSSQVGILPIFAVVGLAMLANIFVAKILGGILPVLAAKLKLDPAVMVSPIITTIADVGGLSIYFLFATLILF